MLMIICGEDTVRSRSYYLQQKKQMILRQYEIREVKADQIDQINFWLAASPSLFTSKSVFFTQNLNKKIKKTDKRFLSAIKKIDKLKGTELIDWEEAAARDLKISKIGKIVEFKPDENIFKLLDAFYPGNRQQFLEMLHRLGENNEENFIFYMLVKRVRQLLLVKEKLSPAKINPWQLSRLKFQAAFWQSGHLLALYEALFKIELGLKTGQHPFTPLKSLDILACHFL